MCAKNVNPKMNRAGSADLRQAPGASRASFSEGSQFQREEEKRACYSRPLRVRRWFYYRIFLRRSAHRLFIISDNRLLPSGVIPLVFLFAVEVEAPGGLPRRGVDSAPSSAAIAWLRRSLSCFSSATMLSMSKLGSFRSHVPGTLFR